MLDADRWYRCRTQLGLSVFGHGREPRKTAEPIEMPFGVLIGVGYMWAPPGEYV